MFDSNIASRLNFRRYHSLIPHTVAYKKLIWTLEVLRLLLENIIPWLYDLSWGLENPSVLWERFIRDLQLSQRIKLSVMRWYDLARLFVSNQQHHKTQSRFILSSKRESFSKFLYMAIFYLSQTVVTRFDLEVNAQLGQRKPICCLHP